MKRRLIALGMICCMLMAPVTVWGNTSAYSSEEIATPWYTYVNVVNTILSIDDGVATCHVKVFENSSKPFDYSKLTVYLKKSSGTTVKTFTATKYPSSLGYFTWTDTYNLTAKGTYYIKAVNKLYKDGSLVETITTTSVNQTY